MRASRCARIARHRSRPPHVQPAPPCPWCAYPMFSNQRLVILDADGTTIDAFRAIEKTFAHHGMDIGPLARFQKRRNMFKYLGGIKEMPTNLRRQFRGMKRSTFVKTLTEVYREEAVMFAGMAQLMRCLAAESDVTVGVVTRNITVEPVATLDAAVRAPRHRIGATGFPAAPAVLQISWATFARSASSSISIPLAPMPAGTRPGTSAPPSIAACIRSWSATVSKGSIGCM